MPKVFISYRRDDSAYVAQNIYDKLAGHYGKESVMFDVDAIPKGVDFVEYLNEQVAECDVLLAIIGHGWLDVRANDGGRRLDNPKDFVRIEIQAALKRKIPVIPVLVGNASMPTAGQLPRGIKALSRRNAAEVRAGRDLPSHLGRLVQDVDACLEHASRLAKQATPPKTSHSTPPPERVRPDSTKREQPSISSPSPPKEASKDLITNSIGMQIKLLEPGTFLMGEDSEQHQVTLTEPFYLGVHPVMQGEYESVMGTNPSGSKGTRHPVEEVKWFDAIEFCNRLSEQQGLPSYYDVQDREVKIRGGEGYRLPTEAEWEYACRAGSKEMYCFGDDESEMAKYAWYIENSDRQTHPVGEKQPNAWGLYDMHGNVWEWCWDWYGKYPKSPQENPTGSPDGPRRVRRGGSWGSSAGYCRSAYRRRIPPEGRRIGLGFRVARSSVRQDQP